MEKFKKAELSELLEYVKKVEPMEWSEVELD